jgi:hypothetical protein
MIRKFTTAYSVASRVRLNKFQTTAAFGIIKTLSALEKYRVNLRDRWQSSASLSPHQCTYIFVPRIATDTAVSHDTLPSLHKRGSTLHNFFTGCAIF